MKVSQQSGKGTTGQAPKFHLPVQKIAESRRLTPIIAALGFLLLVPALHCIFEFIRFPYYSSFREFADIGQAVQLLDGKPLYRFQDMPEWNYAYGYVSAFANVLLFKLSGDVGFPIVRLSTAILALAILATAAGRKLRHLPTIFWIGSAWTSIVLFGAQDTFIHSSKPDYLGLAFAYGAFFATRRLSRTPILGYLIAAVLLSLAFFAKLYFCLWALPLVIYVFVTRGLKDALQLAACGLGVFLAALFCTSWAFEAYPYSVLFSADTLASYTLRHMVVQVIWMFTRFPGIAIALGVVGLCTIHSRWTSEIRFSSDVIYHLAMLLLGSFVFVTVMGGHLGAFGAYLIQLVIIPAVMLFLSIADCGKKATLLLGACFALQAGITIVAPERNLVWGWLEKSRQDQHWVETLIESWRGRSVYAPDIAALHLWRRGMPISENGQSEYFHFAGDGRLNFSILKLAYPHATKVNEIEQAHLADLSYKISQKAFSDVLCVEYSRYCQWMISQPDFARNYTLVETRDIDTATTGVWRYYRFAVRAD